MPAKPLTREVKNKPIKAASANKRSLANKGEFNILWAIVAVVGIALGFVPNLLRVPRGNAIAGG